METISGAETALLGLLSEGPKHPYQLEKDVQYRDMRFWTDLSMSSIYKLLRKLEQRELVSSKTGISEGNRTRKVYRPTRKGNNALKRKLRSLLTEPEQLKWRLHVGLHNLHLLEEAEASECLRQYKEGLQKAIAGYRDLEAFLIKDDCPRHRLQLAIHPIYMLEGELRWVEDYLAGRERSGSER